jgi:nucleoside-diphosphate-sugar epimerase
VRDSTDPNKNKHLRSLPGAADRLALFAADLLKADSFDDAVKGCDGVFHVATPVVFDSTNGEKDVFVPGMKGLEGILGSVRKSATVKVFVLTSSMSAMAPNPEPALKSEKHWSDGEQQKANGDWYSATKTFQEKVAQKFFEEELKTCRYVAICPTMVLGPMLQEGVNGTMAALKGMCKGSMTQAPNDSMSFVDVRDCAAIHIAAYEKPDARGRYMCLITSLHWNDVAVILKKCYPKMPTIAPCEGTLVAPTNNDRTKQDSLGVAIRDVSATLKGAIDCLVERNEL